MRNHYLLLACLLLFVACEAEEPPTPVLSKDFGIHIGTKVDVEGLRSNPAGGVFLKKPDGSLELYKKSSLTIVVSGQYVVEGPPGKYDKEFSADKSVKTDNDGDFSFGFNVGSTRPDESIIKIKKINATMIAIKEGIVYKKTFTFSNDSLWDMATGLSSVFFDLKITELGVLKKTSGTTYTISNVLDIDADLILEAEGGVAGKPKKLASKVFDGARVSGKEVDEKASSPKFKKAQASRQ